MKKLYELTKLIRSKNAGPFMITLDIIFPDKEVYDKVLATGVLDAENVAKMYGCQENQMTRFCLPLANAIKFSYPRPYPSGDFHDDDLYGCQKHAPLVNLLVPVE